MSSSDLVPKPNSMEQLTARRQPDLQILAVANLPAHHIPVVQRRTIITVEPSSCRWPIGDPQQSSFYLCGAKTNAQHSYCDCHMQMAYVPASKARRAA